jgi:hypothetical protein
MERRTDKDGSPPRIKRDSLGKRQKMRIGFVCQANVTRYGLVRSDEGEEKKRA